MRREKRSVLLVFLLMQLCVMSCIEPFNPPEVEQVASYLVVDGFFNTANSASTIRLSRTVNLSDNNTIVPERNASVVVERERGGQYMFKETTDGVYSYPPEFLGEQENYRLKITTQNGRVYVSDFTTAKISPPIDSIVYEVVQNGEAVQLNVNTQDRSGKTRFYRWELTETWEYTAALVSQFYRELNRCWKKNESRRIVIGSTIKLREDILQNAGIATLPVSSNKFLIKYHAFVKQYAITQEAYQYWQALEKTTEGTGSVFDPLPSLVKGNIYCETDSKEVVFGFFSAGAVAEKEVFLMPRLGTYPICYPKQFLLTKEELGNSGLMEIGMDGEKYIVADKECVDCRLQGGTLDKPTFWDN